MMRICLIFLMLVPFAACKKETVDVDSLNYNRFEPTHAGPSFLQVDSIVTHALVAGFIYQQRIYISLDQELYSTPDFILRMVESTDGDTTLITASDPTRSSYLLYNQQVVLGTEYCFHFDLSIGGSILRNHHVSTCAVAEL